MGHTISHRQKTSSSAYHRDITGCLLPVTGHRTSRCQLVQQHNSICTILKRKKVDEHVEDEIDRDPQILIFRWTWVPATCRRCRNKSMSKIIKHMRFENGSTLRFQIDWHMKYWPEEDLVNMEIMGALVKRMRRPKWVGNRLSWHYWKQATWELLIGFKLTTTLIYLVCLTQCITAKVANAHMPLNCGIHSRHCALYVFLSRERAKKTSCAISSIRKNCKWETMFCPSTFQQSCTQSYVFRGAIASMMHLVRYNLQPVLDQALQTDFQWC